MPAATTPAELKQMLAVWLACTLNAQIFQDVINDTADANGVTPSTKISNATGLAVVDVAPMVTAAMNNGNAALFQASATSFTGFANTNLYTSPTGGKTCGTIDEILAALA